MFAFPDPCLAKVITLDDALLDEEIPTPRILAKSQAHSHVVDSRVTIPSVELRQIQRFNIAEQFSLELTKAALTVCLSVVLILLT